LDRRRHRSPMLFRKKKNAAHAGSAAPRTNDLSAFIDEASEIDGKYTFSGTVMLNGKFKGEICSNDTLIIGEKAVVKASIRAGVILISGEVVGNVLGTEHVADQFPRGQPLHEAADAQHVIADDPLRVTPLGAHLLDAPDVPASGVDDASTDQLLEVDLRHHPPPGRRAISRASHASTRHA